ncbi:hypothetical protein V501_00537, partial [Pseudogymnoascus sp. VKM F-4519 (FW-2642)]
GRNRELEERNRELEDETGRPRTAAESATDNSNVSFGLPMDLSQNMGAASNTNWLIDTGMGSALGNEMSMGSVDEERNYDDGEFGHRVDWRPYFHFPKSPTLSKEQDEAQLTDNCMQLSYVWMLLGTFYGLAIAIISLWYIYCITRNSLRSISWNRKVVAAKRHKDAVAKTTFGLVLPIVLQNGIDSAIQRLKSAQMAGQLEEQTTSTALIFQGLPQDTVFQLAFFVMSIFTIAQIRSGQRSKKDFTILFTYMHQLQVPLNSLGTSVQDFQKAVVNSERLISTLKDDSETKITVYAKEITEDAAAIEFDSVAVGLLNSLTFRCETETTTIVRGIPNSERASFMHLLVRVSNAHAGIIRLWGANIEGYTGESLCRRVGLIPRECHLLGENIMGSLKFGLRDIDDKAVFDACAAVNIHDKIVKLPRGYHAPVDQNVCGFDREESRRLTLARLLLQNPGIIICDGAISALNTETNEDLQMALKYSFDRRTVLVFDDQVRATHPADQYLMYSAGPLGSKGLRFCAATVYQGNGSQ